VNHIRGIPVGLCLLAGLAVTTAHAQQQRTTFEVYGFIMMDMGYSFKQNDPAWFDVIRPTKLPSFANEFGEDGRFYFSVRQTRFGVKSSTPTPLGPMTTQFEFEMYGTGADAGQTTIRLRHAYAELGKFGAGQYWSPFMDIDIFPNTVEYWGPTGMVFFRNVQFRFMPIKGDTRLTIALERPGASADQGIYADRIDLAGVAGRFPLPDLSAEYRIARKWGYIEFAGILRYIKWDDLTPTPTNLEGDATGYGINVTSNLKAGKQNVIRLGVVAGAGIQNYMNDAPEDVGVVDNPGDPVTPFLGEALPLVGISAFVDHTWNDRFSSAIGYSGLYIDNTPGQSPDAFKAGHYFIANLMHYPAKNVMLGGELQWGQRINHSDGFKSDDFRIQFSFKYNFSVQVAR
jgi:outer membrane DcaP-like protein